MLRSPSKFLGRSFLKELLENRCLSPRGLEYCEEEVRDSLIEKEQRLALQDFHRELKEKSIENAEKWTFEADKVREFQAQLLNPGILRGQEKERQAKTRCEFFNDNIIFSLPENISLCNPLLAPPNQHQSKPAAPVMSGPAGIAARKDKRMKFPGKPMTEAQVMRELDEIEKLCLKEIAQCNREAAELNKREGSKRAGSKGKASNHRATA